MSKTGSRMIGADQGDRAENDLYTTPAIAVEKLLDVEEFTQFIWEPAVGLGHIAEVLKANGFVVFGSDLIVRGYPGTVPLDFVSYKAEPSPETLDIITNPPYKYAVEFVKQSLKIVREGGKVAMLMRLAFLEGGKRKKFFAENPPIRVHVFSDRISCLKDGASTDSKSGGMTAYAWFIWEKGYKGQTVVDWI